MTPETIVTLAEDAAADRRRWWTLALVVAAQFMLVLGVAIVNVALPSIKTDLHFTQESLQWVVTAYAILFGGALLLGGRMGDLLGRRRMFMAGLALFTVSSLLDGLAWSEGSLIAFRSLQGLAAALLSPAAPAGWGTVSTIGLLAVSAALIASFVVIELRSKAPLLPMRIFRLRTLATSNVTQLLVAAALFSQFFLLTLYMQQVLHYSALKTGVAYVGLTLTIIVFSAVAQALATRIGVRPLLPIGMVLAAVGLVLYTRLPVHGHYFADLFPA